MVRRREQVNARQQQFVPPLQSAVQETRPAVVLPPKIWPRDMAPTQVIHIPDPARPATGVMETRVHPGDELEIRLEPLWVYSMDLPEQIQAAIDDGDGFKPISEFQKKIRETDHAGTNSWWMKGRTVRFRLLPGASAAVLLRLTVDRKSVAEIQPLPVVEAQKFGNLLVGFRGIAPSGNNGTYITVDLDMRNASGNESIAVALFCLNPKFPPFESTVKTTLSGSDGTEYSCDSISGIRALNANPNGLTEIGPNETRTISIKFGSSWGLRGKPSSFKLRSELVMKDHYMPNEYPDNYEPKPGVLPHSCKIYNLVFDIPVRPR